MTLAWTTSVHTWAPDSMDLVTIGFTGNYWGQISRSNIQDDSVYRVYYSRAKDILVFPLNAMTRTNEIKIVQSYRVELVKYCLLSTFRYKYPKEETPLIAPQHLASLVFLVSRKNLILILALTI